MTSLAIGLILEKIASKDKDFRYMATSDLLNELQKDSFKADSETEKKICQIVLQQLEDPSGDISGLAVKCLAPLVKKVNEARVVEVVKSLIHKLTTGKEQQRDIAGIGLKTVVADIASGHVAQAVVAALTVPLIDAISKEGSPEVKSECLDILCDLLHRFGQLIVEDHERMLAALLEQLSSPRATIRKRAVQCLAALAASMADNLLARATQEVISQLRNRDMKPDLTRTYIQTVGALCKSVGFRFGVHLRGVLPLLVGYCKNASEHDDELRENSLQVLESFLLRCPRDVSEHTDAILDLALEYLSYDPNYTDDVDDDDDEEMEEAEDADEDDEDEYSDDEDMSWKVRRAAAKCLSAVICSRPEMLAALYHKACPELIVRFREREENVKIDVFNAFIDLLRQTGNVMKGSSDTSQTSPLYLLQLEVPKVVRSINRQLKEKSVKTKVGAFSVLKELVLVLPTCLSDHFAALVPGIERALNDRSSNSNLKIEALIFTRLTLTSHPPEVVQPHVQALLAPVLAAVAERYYKVAAEALRVTGEMVKSLRRTGATEVGFAFSSSVLLIYGAVLKRLTAQDQDQEVKECAITTMALVISILGDLVQPELPACLALLLDRLRNEITRLTAVKAFETIARSPLHIDLSPVLEAVVGELTSFLRKANRALRTASLCTLDALVSRCSVEMGAEGVEKVVAELAPLIWDGDLQMAALALSLCTGTLLKQPAAAGPGVRDKVLPQALVLVRSSLLQGQALQTLKNFFPALLQSGTTSFDILLNSLLSSVKEGPMSPSGPSPAHLPTPGLLSIPTPATLGGPAAKQAYHSIAQCAAVLTVAAGDVKLNSTVDRLVTSIKAGGQEHEGGQLLGLLCVGEIGRKKDLSRHEGIELVVMQTFTSTSEEIKAAASYSLGNMAVGNLAKYLPFILGQIEEAPKLQYLLLHSLKDVIARQSIKEDGQELSEEDVEKMLQLLFAQCESEEEGVRNVVAECLGKLALIQPAKIIPQLQAHTQSPSTFTRGTVVTALKFTIVERPQPVDAFVQPCIANFLRLIEDPDRHVRRAAVSALSSAAHHKAVLVADLLPSLLPKLYDQTIIKPDLIRTVDLGPFKHTVDDGLELRKTAFECIDTLLDTCLDRIDPSGFIIPHLLSGLGEHYDVKMPCHLILSKLAERCGPAVLAVLDALVEPLEKTVLSRTKPDAVKQEVDRNEDMIRSALRAIDSLARVPNAENSSPRFKTFMKSVVRSGDLGDKYQIVRQESESLVLVDRMDTS